MFTEIIKQTPIWVFILFFVLLVLGYLQSKQREVGRLTIFILPISMNILSLYGVISAFGASVSALTSWIIGIGFAIAIGLLIKAPKGVEYFQEAKLFSITGSWFPLILMMAIFFTKYVVGVVLARQLPIANDFNFIIVISFLYGCFSGLFLSRLLVTWQSTKK